MTPLKEFYLVGVGDNPQDALKALHEKEGLGDAELQLIGEAPPNVVEWLDMKPGEILCVMAVI